MKCSSVHEVLFLYTDNEMEEELRISVREHVAICPECERRLDYTTRLVALLRKRCKRAVAPSRLRRRILTSLPHRRQGPLFE